MVEVVYYAAASLDGQIATRDGGVDWLPKIEDGAEASGATDYGYHDFYSSFRERGLIHAYGIGIAPTIVGSGIPLLAPHGGIEKLSLTGCQTYPDGVVVLWYRKAEE